MKCTQCQTKAVVVFKYRTSTDQEVHLCKQHADEVWNKLRHSPSFSTLAIEDILDTTMSQTPTQMIDAAITLVKAAFEHRDNFVASYDDCAPSVDALTALKAKFESPVSKEMRLRVERLRRLGNQRSKNDVTRD